MSISLPHCPHCDARLCPSPDGKRLWCQFCGTTRDDPDALQKLEVYQASTINRTAYDPPAREIDMSLEQRRTLDSAWDSIQTGDLVTAAYILQYALREDPNFADAWYLRSMTIDDRAEKLTCLNNALQAQPYHEYAWRDKGVLEGVIPPCGEGQVGAMPDPVEPVEAESKTQSCPTCTGALTFDAALGTLICHHCGFRPGDLPRARFRGGYDKLDHALLQRRFGFSKAWRIGERVLVCQNCHAQLTLSSSTLSTQCPFCDTSHVLVQDAVGSFEQPDALLPFKVDRQAAASAVHRRLSSGVQQQIERGEIQGVYLPFWAFRLVTIALEYFTPVSHNVGDVLVSGAVQPAQAVLYELMPYDLSQLVSYDHRYLAQWPAQIYSLDVIQASITGWAYIKYAAWQRVYRGQLPLVELARTDRDAYHLPDQSMSRELDRIKVEGLRYRLLLLPVWMITLHMANGMRRPAVVNGQTGEAIISASFASPETIIAGPNRATLELEPRRTTVIRPIQPR